MTKDIPNFLQQLSTDEYSPAPHSDADCNVIARAGETIESATTRYRLRPQQLHRASATAAGLIALNEEYGQRFFDVHPDAVVDDATAAAAFASEGLVIDVQTHFMAPHAMHSVPCKALQDMYRATMPRWWTEVTGDGGRPRLGEASPGGLPDERVCRTAMRHEN